MSDDILDGNRLFVVHRDAMLAMAEWRKNVYDEMTGKIGKAANYKRDFTHNGNMYFGAWPATFDRHAALVVIHYERMSGPDRPTYDALGNMEPSPVTLGVGSLPPLDGKLPAPVTPGAIIHLCGGKLRLSVGSKRIEVMVIGDDVDSAVFGASKSLITQLNDEETLALGTLLKCMGMFASPAKVREHVRHKTISEIKQEDHAH